MGTSNQVTQNGNTTVGWAVQGGSISNHDTIVIALDNAGGSGVKLSDLAVWLNPTRYSFSTTVVGPDAVAFRVNNGGI
jgi:hypothetical protein